MPQAGRPQSQVQPSAQSILEKAKKVGRPHGRRHWTFTAESSFSPAWRKGLHGLRGEFAAYCYSDKAWLGFQMDVGMGTVHHHGKPRV